jgi:hypothetical protein
MRLSFDRATAKVNSQAEKSLTERKKKARTVGLKPARRA